jgi:hypothetical protein
MNKLLRHSTFAWALIAAQLLVVVLGHGRVMVCHDESGASHIELFGDTPIELSDATSSTDLCGLITYAKSKSTSGVCSDVPCEDELFGLVFTLSQSRTIGLASLAGLIPSAPISIDALTIPSYSTGGLAQAIGSDDASLLRAQHRTIRSTVLII